MVIKSNIADAVWRIETDNLSEEDELFIQNFDPLIYHNDLEGYLWAFDTKLPSGRWLENMRFKNDLAEALAYIEPMQ